jgi:hypothetical protein
MTQTFVTRAAAVLAATLWTAPAAWAQQRPLVTEDPETVGSGRLLIEGGFDYERDVVLPVSGLRGNLTTVPTLGFSFGVSSIAEIQIDGGFYQRLDITDRRPAPFSSILAIAPDAARTTGVEDLSLATKVRIVSESATRPAMGLRFVTRLPNASNESGLGRDVQDFTASVLVGKTVQSVRVVANAGFQILGDPTKAARQDDLIVFSLSLARAVTAGAEVVGEYWGRANFANGVTPGAEDRGLMRFGGRYTHGAFRLDGGVLVGVTPRDPEIGLTVGFTWVLNAFRVP